MDPVLNKPATTSPPLSQDSDAVQDSPPDLDEGMTPQPPRPVPPPLPDLDDDLVKPGSVEEDDESAVPETTQSPAPRDEVPTQAGIKTPPPPPPLVPSQEPEETPMEPAATPPVSKGSKSKILLAAGPLFLVATLGISAVIVNSRPAQPTQYPAKPAYEFVDDPQLKEKWDGWMDNVPQNPTEVEAVCQSTGEAIPSGQPTSCPIPQFTWSGAQANEPGTNIIGYNVYFGTENTIIPFPDEGFEQAVSPKKMGTFQGNNIYQPQDLASGTTYYLFVQSVTDSSNQDYQAGASIVDRELYKTRPADILFTYVYE